MAETNHTSSATNNDCNASSPNVPENERVTLNRRQAMQLITSAATVPALAFAAVPASAAGLDRSTWDAEYARFKAVDVEYDRRILAEEEAREAVDAECPREDRFFDEYDLRMGMKREAVVWHARHAVAEREGFNGLVLFPKESAVISNRKADALRAEAERIADEFMAYQERHNEAWERHGVDGLREVAEEYRPLWFAARDRFMAVPAPDVEALLVKLQIAGTWVDDDYVTSSFEDARRLLAQGNA